MEKNTIVITSQKSKFFRPVEPKNSLKNVPNDGEHAFEDELVKNKKIGQDEKPPLSWYNFFFDLVIENDIRILFCL